MDSRIWILVLHSGELLAALLSALALAEIAWLIGRRMLRYFRKIEMKEEDQNREVYARTPSEDHQ